MHRKWNKDAIALEILSMYESGETLNYSSVAGNNLSLLRAATRYFGTWEDAVRFAGLDYDLIRRYKSPGRANASSPASKTCIRRTSTCPGAMSA